MKRNQLPNMYISETERRYLLQVLRSKCCQPDKSNAPLPCLSILDKVRNLDKGTPE